MSKNNYVVVPPSNFCYIEENICRCTLPLARSNMTFLDSLAVTTILNLSGRKLDSSILNYCEDNEIRVKNLLGDGGSPPMGSVAQLNNWIGTSLELILKCSKDKLILMIGSDTYIDCLVVACLRRLQLWSYVSVVAEFRQFTWPHRLFDFEQVIEQFPCHKVDMQDCTPEFLALHESFQKEETLLLNRCAEQQTRTAPIAPQNTGNHVCDSSTGEQSISPPMAIESAAGASECAEQARIDEILKTLFFSPRHQLLSDAATFDATVSLINDKDEED